MKKVKKVITISIVMLCIVGIIAGIWVHGEWPVRYKAQLNQFFGEGNWKCVDRSKDVMTTQCEKENIFGGTTEINDNLQIGYKIWTIDFKNRYEKEETAELLNIAIQVNHYKYYEFFNPKRWSTKQAIGAELMDIACNLAGEEVVEDFVKSELTESEANCIYAQIGNEGRLSPKVYSKLLKKPWFKSNEVTAKDLLTWDELDCSIDLMTSEYRFSKLSEEEQQDVLNSMERIAENLLNEYGEDASFYIHFDDTHEVKYVDGKKAV